MYSFSIHNVCHCTLTVLEISFYIYSVYVYILNISYGSRMELRIWKQPEGPVTPPLIWIWISGLEIEMNRWQRDGIGSGWATGPGRTHAVPATPWNRWGFYTKPTQELLLSLSFSFSFTISQLHSKYWSTLSYEIAYCY